MMRLLAGALFVATTAGMAGAQAAVSGPSTLITQASVSDVVIGSPVAIAYDVFGAYPTEARHPAGYTRLTFPQPQVPARHGGVVQVYLLAGVRRIAAIVVTDARWRTVEGVGPCTSVPALVRTYRGRLEPFREHGTIVGYRLGTMFFATNAKRVTAVALSRPGGGRSFALSAPACRSTT